ncbi:MAG: Na+/H+ antiporter NhaA [Alphaproteobacteria bacterium]|nr:MAG: Na+/H+ antiporter NhaA [Alphaproteobacteria bacterium]
MKRLKVFLQSDAGSAVPLLAAAVLALALANSPLDEAVTRLLHIEIAANSLVHWIDDGLMVAFFLLVGMEIKREVVLGELSKPAQMVLPVAGALGGIVVPAAFYAVFTWGDRAALNGWAIASATDIAFAVAIVAALGPRRVPPGLRLFLLTLAIVDDLAAIVIIAIFYTAQLSTLSLLGAAVCILALVGLNRLGVRRMLPYLAIGIVLWLCVLKSGVHATLSGVVLAFCLPLGERFERLEHELKPWVLFFVMPLFAFANSGLNLGGLTVAMVRDPIVLGIVAGLFVGKQLGVFAGAALPVAFGLARLPDGATWRQLYGVGVCGGIGFTMSLFIGTLAFEGADKLALVQLGVLAGSLLSAAFGYALLRVPGRHGA